MLVLNCKCKVGSNKFVYVMLALNCKCKVGSKKLQAKIGCNTARYAKYTFYCIFVIVTQWSLIFSTIYQFWQISIYFFPFFFQLNLLEIVLFQTSVGGIQIRYVVSTRVFLAIFVFSQNDDHAWEDIKTKQNGNHP